MDDDVAGAQCRSPYRMRRFSFIRRVSPSQAQLWSLIHDNTGQDVSDTSSAIGRQVIFASIFETALLITLWAYSVSFYDSQPRWRVEMTVDRRRRSRKSFGKRASFSVR